MSNLAIAKAQRRAEARALVASLAPAARAEQAARLMKIILASAEWKAARCLLLFVPLPDEIDLWQLIPTALAAGKRVCLPAFDEETGVYLIREIRDPSTDLVPGRFKILEPSFRCSAIPIAELDLLLVPGLAFDAEGGRLGRGNGYYDRLLAPGVGLIWGVGFVEQMGKQIPHELHDRRLHGVFTAAGRQASSRLI